MTKSKNFFIINSCPPFILNKPTQTKKFIKFKNNKNIRMPVEHTTLSSILIEQANEISAVQGKAYTPAVLLSVKEKLRRKHNGKKKKTKKIKLKKSLKKTRVIRRKSKRRKK